VAVAAPLGSDDLLAQVALGPVARAALDCVTTTACRGAARPVAGAWPSGRRSRRLLTGGGAGTPPSGQPLVVRTIEVPLAPLVRARWPTAQTVLGPTAAASHREPAELGIDSRVQLLPFQRRTSDPPTA
jgi:hypothetical protein